MRCLITGGAGFLGSHLTDRLLEAGHEVIVFDNLITGREDNLAHRFGHPGFRFVKQDVTEFLYLPGDLDAVVHFASPASPIDYLRLPLATLKTGSYGTHNALGLAKQGKTLFYRDFLHHLRHSGDRFRIAPGIKGMVMLVFDLPSFPYVFKLIKDFYPPQKETTREQIQQKYLLVKQHDRVGRMADTLEYSNVAFPRARFETEERQGRADRLAVLTFGVLLVHSLPEGLAIGAAWEASGGLATFVILAIAIQNIPEGTAVAVALEQAGRGPWEQFRAAVVSSAPQIPGALLAWWAVDAINGLLPVSFAAAGAAMLALVGAELVPAAWRAGGHRSAAGGVLAGAAIMGLIAVILSPAA